MRSIKKLCSSFLITYLIIFPSYLYLFQEKEIFQSIPLSKDYIFSSDIAFEEHFIPVAPNVHLHSLLFFSEAKKGVVLYFHGRGGNLAKPWSSVIKDFTERGYDCLIFDYRGFGKSTGTINNEQVILDDAEKVYKFLSERYPLKDTIFYGTSLGTGIATYLASKYSPKMLILESPYCRFSEVASGLKPYFPKFLITFLLKYQLRTDLWIQKVLCPIYVFHSKADTLIPYKASLTLQQLALPNQLTLILLENAAHHLIIKESVYQRKLTEILSLSL